MLEELMAVFHTFHREPPPGFRGLQPHLPIRFYARHLPHWRQDGATYFVTFRLADALPPDDLKAIQTLREHWNRTHPHPRSEKAWEDFARTVTQRSEDCLDKGHGACYFSDPKNAELLGNALRHYQTTRCFVPCFIVMPNHAHAVMKPLPGNELEDVLKLIKGFVAHQLNQNLEQHGSLWEQESYDRIIRDEVHLENVIRYIGRNGLKAGLPADRFLRWIDPDWVKGGWDFD